MPKRTLKKPTTSQDLLAEALRETASLRDQATYGSITQLLASAYLYGLGAGLEKARVVLNSK